MVIEDAALRRAVFLTFFLGIVGDKSSDPSSYESMTGWGQIIGLKDKFLTVRSSFVPNIETIC